MASSAKAALGTTIKIDGVLIGEIKSIKLGPRTAKTIDVTSHDSTMEEFVAGMKSGGEVTISGLFVAGNAGQVALNTAYQTTPQVTHTYLVTLPVATATTVTFDAVISSLGFPASAEFDGAIDFTATLKVSGTVTVGIGASTGVSACVVTFNAGAGTGVPTPWAIGTLEYAYTCITTESWTKFTATFAAGTCTVYNPVDGSTTSLTSTVISSALTHGAAGTITSFVVTQTDTNKVAKTYTVRVIRP